MAQGGHFDADLYRLDGRNGSNLPVLEIVSDYQSLRNGGDGYLRIYEIDTTTDLDRFNEMHAAGTLAELCALA